MTDRRCQRCNQSLPVDAPDGPCPACLLRAGIEHTSAAAAGKFQPPKPEDLAASFPQLELIELIGQGGMGAVYKARQRHLDRMVALKVLPPDLGRDPAFAERFAREARSLARLSHPNLVTIHDFGQNGEWCWIVMEYVDGANLRQVLSTGALSPAQALKVVPQLCEALQYAHDQGIVHRDIKPENILMDRTGRVKIADFGLAKLIVPDASARVLTATQDVMGTAHYMAPEQVERSRDVDHRADIYSLGVVFYEMLTGGLPLGRFALPSKTISVDVRLDEVVLKALEKDPQRRYQQASEVKTDVERIATAPAGGSAAQKASEPDEEHRAAILLQLLAVFVAGAAIAAVMHHPPGSAGVWAAFPCLIASAIGLWGGWRLMRGERSWGWAAKLSAIAMIPLLIAIDDQSPWALMPVLAVIYLFHRPFLAAGGSALRHMEGAQERIALRRARYAQAVPPQPADGARVRSGWSRRFFRGIGGVVMTLAPLVVFPCVWLIFSDYGVTDAIDDAERLIPALREPHEWIGRADIVAADVQRLHRATNDLAGLFAIPDHPVPATPAFTDLRAASDELSVLADEVHEQGMAVPTARRARELLATLERSLVTMHASDSDRITLASGGTGTLNAFPIIADVVPRISASVEQLGTVRPDTMRSLISRLRTKNDALPSLRDAARRFCFSSAQANRLVQAIPAPQRPGAAAALRSRITDPEHFFFDERPESAP